MAARHEAPGGPDDEHEKEGTVDFPQPPRWPDFRTSTEASGSVGQERAAGEDHTQVAHLLQVARWPDAHRALLSLLWQYK